MKMENFIITKQQIEDIWNLLQERRLSKVKEILNNLKGYEEDTLRDELTRFIREKGKSTVLKSELLSLLKDTKLNLEDKMTEETEETEEKETNKEGSDIEETSEE